MCPDQSGPRIVVVDDDPSVRQLLNDCFQHEGYAVVEASDGRQLKAILEETPVDLVTLDLNLGGEDGLTLAREIRAVRNVPIVMITGKGDTIDRVVGLELGADDYIVKPFHVREVLARIRAVLRRYAVHEDSRPSAPMRPADAGRETPDEERYAFEGWVLNVPRRELRSQQGDIRELTTAEFDLLLVLVKRPSRVLTRDNLMDLLKGQSWSPMDRSIDSLVARLRKKIEADIDAPQLVKTVRGVGYVFAANVTSV